MESVFGGQRGGTAVHFEGGTGCGTAGVWVDGYRVRRTVGRTEGGGLPCSGPDVWPAAAIEWGREVFV